MRNSHQVSDPLLTYTYPRTLAEAKARFPCAGDESVAVHGPYTDSYKPDRIVLRTCYVVCLALLFMVWRGWV